MDDLGRSVLDALRPSEEEREPTFTIRAQDRLGPAAVRDWAHRAKGAGVAQEKVNGAMEIALQMDIWQAKNPGRVKWPD